MDRIRNSALVYILVLILIFSNSIFFLSLKAAAAQQQYNVQIKFGDAEGENCAGVNNCYVPSSVTILNGDTVVWTNNDNSLHTVTKDLSNDQTHSIFFAKLLKPGGKFLFTFSSPGTYHYSCRIHPWMTGEIIVEESTMSTTSNPTLTPTQIHPQLSNNVTKTQSPSQTTQIPNWIRNNAKWWHDNAIGDSDFEKGIQYLIQHGIMKIPQAQSGTGTTKEVPSWVKNNAGWWASGQISNDEFVKGIQYMISSGIIKIS